MIRHAIPIDGVLEALESWLESIHHDKQDLARTDTERLKIFARMLAEDREFRNIFRSNGDHCGQCDAAQALRSMHAFLNAVGDATRPGAFRAKGP